MSTDSNGKTDDAVVALAATFVAEPLEKSLQFWLSELDFNARLTFAPYNQVFQELLSSSSTFGTNRNGINVILVRLEDWGGIRIERNPGDLDYIQINRSVNDFICALKTSSERTHTPHAVFLCPPSLGVATNHDHAKFCKETESLIARELKYVHGVYVITSDELANLYPMTGYYDQEGDRLANIPYTPTFYSALGTMIARKLSALTIPRPKVIVLDCDHTLWNGVCAEDGPLGIKIEPPYQKIQEFMVRQHDAGVLICICSKNDEHDVFEVFEQRREMTLKRENIVSWRINWLPKSRNIKSLANELNLALDSFVFFDDNPIECAEVEANCPEVLTFCLPESVDDRARFLNHLWILDHTEITTEAQERTELYKQNAQRVQSQNDSLTFKEFIEGLNLKITIAALKPEYIARVAELTQRTNQFNLTNVRRSASEMEGLCNAGDKECLTVHVRDRFGDYGLVGMIIFQIADGVITIDTFLLSCRALGRGVEHQMFATLGEIAQQRDVRHIEAPYRQTTKNRPMLEFLNSVCGGFAQPANGSILYKIPANFAAAVRYDPGFADEQESPSEEITWTSSESNVCSQNLRERASFWRLIADDMCDSAQIHRVISEQRNARPLSKATYVEPSAPIEQKLAHIYSEFLGVERVGVNDNFFDLGGHSLLAMQVLSRIREDFQVDIPIKVLFTSKFSVAEIAQTVGEKQIEQVASDEVSGVLEQLEHLSEAEVKEMFAASTQSDLAELKK